MDEEENLLSTNIMQGNNGINFSVYIESSKEDIIDNFMTQIYHKKLFTSFIFRSVHLLYATVHEYNAILAPFGSQHQFFCTNIKNNGIN